ncbi:hypothetical protein GGR51DRAFT_507589 [Nemania sp. FL0031]|nr:hypothetical protein GGR51DRAFT_507589 [Nemania sp. FL0031]
MLMIVAVFYRSYLHTTAAVASAEASVADADTGSPRSVGLNRASRATRSTSKSSAAKLVPYSPQRWLGMIVGTCV